MIRNRSNLPYPSGVLHWLWNPSIHYGMTILAPYQATWNVESKDILQLPKYLVIVDRFDYMNNNVIKKRSLISLDLNIMGLLPDTQICGCACAGNVFPVTAGKRSRHASRHVRHARAVMHAGIANQRFPLKSAAGENVSSIPGACATCNFTYLVRGLC